MLSGQTASMIFQAAYFVLIGRALGSHEYGEFVGVASLIGVLGQFSCFGMEIIIIRDVGRDNSRFPSSWGLALELSALGFALITAIAMTVGHFILSREAQALIPFIALSELLFAKLVVLCSKVFQGFSNFGMSAALMMLTNAVRAVVAGALYVYVIHSHRLSTAYTWTKVFWIGSLFTSIVGMVCVTRLLGVPVWKRPSLNDISEGISFSVSGSSMSIYNDIDKTYLVSLGQNAAAGIYSAAYRVVDVASTPVISVYTAAFPHFFREGAKSVRHASRLARKLLLKTGIYALAAAILMYFAAPVLPYFLGKSFASSTSALRWLCLLPLIRCFHYAGGATITGSVSQWYRTALLVSAAVLNLGLNALLIPRYSWQGAAAASLLTDGTLAVLTWSCVAWLIARQERIKVQAVTS
jgi:O-antigen/teichoic acid export membrane protein